MAKNCKHFLYIQKLSPFFVHYVDYYDPQLGGQLGRWPATGGALHKSQMEQIYTYDFVRKGYLRLLTIFWKY